jgi:hypothetical protein
MAYKEFKCIACELCYSEYQVRLTEDGQYYCSICREVCDYKTQDSA